jgi:hypothetical protein
VYRLDRVVVGKIASAGEVVTVEATSAAAAGICPECGVVSTRVHRRYRRVVQDLPSGGRLVRVGLTVRRFRCGTPDCPRRTFAEQVDGVTRPHRSRVQRLEAVLGAFGAALGGRAGTRLAERAGRPVRGDTLLRLLRRGAPARPPTPRVLGVDDWAWRRGLRFGTILVDLEAGRTIDRLPERTSDGLCRWRQAHLGVEIIARDRSTEYARGATAGAPDAVQVLDRWPVLRNAREVAERHLPRHPDQLRALVTPTPGAVPPALPPRRSAHEEARRKGACDRTIERHAAVRQLAAAGLSGRVIAKRLGRARVTVRRYRHMHTPRSAGHPRGSPVSSIRTGPTWSTGGPQGAGTDASYGGRSATRASPARASRWRAGRRRVAPPSPPPPHGGTGPSPASPRHRPRRPPPAAHRPDGWRGCWCASRRGSTRVRNGC